VDNPDAALERYLTQKDDLHAGRTPRTNSDGLTLRELLNRFLTSKQRLLSAGEIVRRTFDDYRDVCDRIAKSLDITRPVLELRTEDFEKLRAHLAKTRGPTVLANDITRIRIAFKYAYDAGLIDKPVHFGGALKKPNRRALRLARQKRGPRRFDPQQLPQSDGVHSAPAFCCWHLRPHTVSTLFGIQASASAQKFRAQLKETEDSIDKYVETVRESDQLVDERFKPAEKAAQRSLGATSAISNSTGTSMTRRRAPS
jgi:hypothetical protein